MLSPIVWPERRTSYDAPAQAIRNLVVVDGRSRPTERFPAFSADPIPDRDRTRFEQRILLNFVVISIRVGWRWGNTVI